MRPKDGGIDSFCLKLGQSNLKELVKVPCGYRCHTMHKSRLGRSRKVREGHFQLHWYVTRDLGVIFHAVSDGHGNISPKLTFVIISEYLKHKIYFMLYIT